MAPKITATIDHLTEHEFDQIAAAGAGSRYEVVLEYTDGDHHELEAHFRLAVLNSTRAPDLVPPMVRAHEQDGSLYRTKSGRLLTDADIERLAEEAERGYGLDQLLKQERQLHPMRVMHVGSPAGTGPEFSVPEPAGLVQRLSQVIGQLVRFSAFDARRLGIDKREGETVEQAVGRWLRS
jgi:hypothetical protein